MSSAQDEGPVSVGSAAARRASLVLRVNVLRRTVSTQKQASFVQTGDSVAVMAGVSAISSRSLSSSSVEIWVTASAPQTHRTVEILTTKQ